MVQSKFAALDGFKNQKVIYQSNKQYMKIGLGKLSTLLGNWGKIAHLNKINYFIRFRVFLKIQCYLSVRGLKF